MCELFGVSSAEKLEVNDLLRKFFSHGVDHPHGWGMAFFYGNAVSLEKQPEPSYASRYLKQRLQARIHTASMIAHIRLATKGVMEYINTHPFVMRDNSGRTWTLAHNGTIFDAPALNPFVHSQEGATDSERILCYIISRVNAEQDRLRRPLSEEGRFRLLDQIICQLAPENKLNLLLYDSELLYVHTNYRDSLHLCRKGAGLVFSTQPLDRDRWEPLPMNRLLSYRDGLPRRTGTDHGAEFFDSEEKMRLLFLDFSAL